MLITNVHNIFQIVAFSPTAKFAKKKYLRCFAKEAIEEVLGIVFKVVMKLLSFLKK